MTVGFAPLEDGGRLAYAVSGRDGAPPILLLRPLGGSMALWGAFAERLAAELQVIAFDPRGVGDSSDARLLETTREMARDAIELLDHLRVPRPHVFGLSLGGMVASWLAIDHADRVDHLVLASTLPKPSAISARVVEEAVPLALAAMHVGPAAELALVHEILSPEFRAAEPERVREIEALVQAHPTSQRNLMCLMTAAARHHAASELHAVTAKTLVLVGELDPIIGERAEHELLHDIPGAKLAIVPRSGHDLSLEQPVAAADLILQFLHVG